MVFWRTTLKVDNFQYYVTSRCTDVTGLDAYKLAQFCADRTNFLKKNKISSSLVYRLAKYMALPLISLNIFW